MQTPITNFPTFSSIISQTRHNIDNMAGIVDPYIIVDQCLQWIGFGIPNQRSSISTEAGFNSLDDLNDIEEKDIRDMADSFQKRTIANRINFGMRHTKWLIAMMHWVQDFYRCSKQPTIDDFVTANDFKQALSTAAQRASLRKVDTDQVDTISKAADPGKLKDEGSGRNGIPLSSITFPLDLGSMVYRYHMSFGKTKRQTTPVILRATSQRRSLHVHL